MQLVVAVQLVLVADRAQGYQVQEVLHPLSHHHAADGGHPSALCAIDILSYVALGVQHHAQPVVVLAALDIVGVPVVLCRHLDLGRDVLARHKQYPLSSPKLLIITSPIAQLRSPDLKHLPFLHTTRCIPALNMCAL